MIEHDLGQFFLEMGVWGFVTFSQVTIYAPGVALEQSGDGSFGYWGEGDATVDGHLAGSVDVFGGSFSLFEGGGLIGAFVRDIFYLIMHFGSLLVSQFDCLLVHG